MKAWLLAGFLGVGLVGCVKLPSNVEPVSGFEADRYLGTWYEIARLDHSFEEGLSKVTAEYSLREDGGIKVVNRGFSEEKGEWEEAEGKAYFVENEQTGFLKVSFLAHSMVPTAFSDWTRKITAIPGYLAPTPITSGCWRGSRRSPRKTSRRLSSAQPHWALIPMS